MAEQTRRTELAQAQARGLHTEGSILNLTLGEALQADNFLRDTNGSLFSRNGCTRYDKITSRVIGLYDHEWISRNRGAIHHHLIAGSDGSLWVKDASGLASRVAGQVVTPTESDFVSFVTISGDTYITYGDGRLSVYDGENRWFAGITSPEFSPRWYPDSTPAETLTGTYFLLVTFIYRTSDGRTVESDPSPAMQSGAVTDGTAIRWVWQPPPPDQLAAERINGYRLYRSRSSLTTPEGAPLSYSFLAEILDVNQLEYVDTKDDTLLTYPAPTEGENQLPPLSANQVIHYNNSLFTLGSEDDPHLISYSPTGIYESFPPDHFIKLPTSSTSPITGAVVHKGVLVVFLEDEIWHITGANPSTFRADLMLSKVGCVAQASVVSVGDIVVFLGRNDLFSWDLQNVNAVSTPIHPEFAENSIENMRSAHASIYRKLGLYLIVMRCKDGVIRWFALDYRTNSAASPDSTDTYSRAFFRFVCPSGVMDGTCLSRVFEFSSKEERVMFGRADGSVLRFDDGSTDDGEMIEAVWRAPIFPYEAGKPASGPKSLNQGWRHWIVFTDDFHGTAQFGWGWFASDAQDDFELFDTDTITRNTTAYVENRVNLYGTGQGCLIVEIRYTGVGRIRILGQDFLWHLNRFGMRGSVQ